MVMKRLFYILPLILLFSCSVQKRKYQKGFYVSHTNHQKHIQKTISSNSESENLVLKSTILSLEKHNNIELSASADNKVKPFIKLPSVFLTTANDSLCDVITLKNGDDINAKILEITPIEVKYKKCNAPDGPLYIAKKSDIFMVKYANGTKEVFKQESTEPKQIQNPNSNKNNYIPKKTHPLAIAALVFSIIGFVTYGIGSIVGLILANLAIKKVLMNSEIYKGDTLAKVAKIMSIVMIAIMLTVLLIFLLLLSAGLI
jgi:hypothetical protein